jgi:hypothetical protein
MVRLRVYNHVLKVNSSGDLVYSTIPEMKLSPKSPVALHSYSTVLPVDRR